MTKEGPGIPLYYLVKEKILEMIHSNKLEIGDKLPTEHELCTKLGVSRTTIRLALQRLELEGRVQRIQGKGTFVAQPKIQHTFSTISKSFSEQIKDIGLYPKSKVIHFEVIPAPLPISGILQIDEKDPVFKLERLRFANEEPLQLLTSFVPWKVAPGLQQKDCSGSLFQLLRTKYGVNIHRSVESVEPFLIDEAMSKLLHVPAGSPSLLLKSTTYDKDDQPIEYSIGITRGEQIKFAMEHYYH
ncbi:GntR family transcriptional regulator [Ammoniphilus sp. YIM 78166]|uniref:GntR family transcriptional regulator n=1 Tax=Ammoniphilus sp. YIM 78166 TaxID=1644106 RepID=UPI00106FA5D9|nr:GntR family transcriptional regulator [Ammoniphilus sp. YIM 78166]